MLCIILQSHQLVQQADQDAVWPRASSPRRSCVTPVTQGAALPKGRRTQRGSRARPPSTSSLGRDDLQLGLVAAKKKWRARLSAGAF